MACSGGEEVAEHLCSKSTASESSHVKHKANIKAAIFSTRGFRATPPQRVLASPMARHNRHKEVGVLAACKPLGIGKSNKLVVETGQIGGLLPR